MNDDRSGGPRTRTLTLSRSSSPSARAAQGGGEAEILLSVRPVQGTPREVVADRPLTVGSAPANDLVLCDAFVSARHACLVPRPGGVHVRDRGSKNGTYVNGVRLTEGFAPAGTRLLLGRTEIEVGRGGAGGGPPLPAVPSRRALLGEAPAFRAAVRLAERVAPHRIPVLVTGETGCGKELFARLLHELGPSPLGRLVAVNCGALPESLVESELFGHERGAFTGAMARRMGAFREASPGTLFLDEIGELPATQQAKLLRALETGRVRAVGASDEVAVDVRVIAATHRDLAAAAEEGRFRLDLYHRLAAVILPVPALRDRPGDARLLAGRFLEELASDSGPRALAPDALDALDAYPWPGNVRELRNAVWRAVALGGPVLHAADLLPARRARPTAAGTYASGPARDDPGGQLAAAAAKEGAFYDVERRLIADALQKAGGSARRAARAVGLPRSTFYDRARRYGLL